MPDHNINLIRGRVPGAARRKLMYLGMLAYLGITGCILAWEANRGAHRLEVAGRQRFDLVRLENEFRARYGEDADIVETATALEGRLDATAKRLDQFSIAARQTLLPARVLVGLSQPLPRPLRVTSLQLDAETRRADFSVAEPVNDSGSTLHARELIELWMAHPLLVSQFEDIETLGTERTLLLGQATILHRFTARLQGRKGN